MLCRIKVNIGKNKSRKGKRDAQKLIDEKKIIERASEMKAFFCVQRK